MRAKSVRSRAGFEGRPCTRREVARKAGTMTARAPFPGPRNAFLAVAAMALGMACLQGNRPPEVAPRGTLGIGAGDEAAAVDTRGAFGVVFASPRGETLDPPEVSLVFNRPMRPLDLAGEESASPATIEPAVPGRWGWVGTNALTFVPEKHLPRATSFVVRVPAGTKALDGTALDKPFELRFSTAPPKITSVEPYDGASDLRPDAKFTLRFNQPVGIPEIERAVTLTAGSEKRTFSVRRPDPENEQLAEIVPRAPLPLDTAIELTAKGIGGTEGPMRSKEEATYSFTTYGPLSVKELPCDHDTPHGRCAPDGGIGIYLSNRVKLAELKKAVRFEPKIDVTWPSWLDDDHLTEGPRRRIARRRERAAARRRLPRERRVRRPLAQGGDRAARERVRTRSAPRDPDRRDQREGSRARRREALARRRASPAGRSLWPGSIAFLQRDRWPARGEGLEALAHGGGEPALALRGQDRGRARRQGRARRARARHPLHGLDRIEPRARGHLDGGREGQ